MIYMYMRIFLKYIILILIQLIEKWEYRNMSLDEDDVSKKIMNSIDVNNFLIETPEGYSNIKSIHKTQPYTIWEIETESGIKLEAADKHILFDKNDNEIFIKDLAIGNYIQTKNGIDKITKIKKLPIKVSMYDITVNNKNHTYYSNGIKSHNTTTIAAYFAWYLCFHNDRNLAILANKQATAFEIVSKVIDVFKGLPFYLKPGIVNAGAGGLRLDNGCMLTSQATTKTAQIGFTIHVLYADEFAHIQNSIVRSFWRSVYPTLSSSNISQCIISSTPNGEDNLFYEIWNKAVHKLNSFYHIRVDWWEVPGHDEAWKEKMIADFGQDEFDQEFGLSFQAGKSNSLLTSSHLKFISKIYKQYVNVELEKSSLELSDYLNLKWHPDFDPNEDFDSSEHRFVISIDTGEGKDLDEIKDNDYNVVNIFKVSPISIAKLKSLTKHDINIKNMFRLTQVGLYRDNIKDEEICARVAKSIIFEQLDPNLCKILIEMNFNGKFFLSKFAEHPLFDEDVVFHTYHTAPIEGEKKPRKKPGFKVGRDKNLYLKIGKKMVDRGLLILTEDETYTESKAFGKDKNGKYRGIGEHDDIMMSALNTSRLYNDEYYEEWLYDFLEDMKDSEIKRLIMKLLDKYEESNEMSDKEFEELYGDQNSIENLYDNYNPFSSNNSYNSYRNKYLSFYKKL